MTNRRVRLSLIAVVWTVMLSASPPPAAAICSSTCADDFKCRFTIWLEHICHSGRDSCFTEWCWASVVPEEQTSAKDAEPACSGKTPVPPAKRFEIRELPLRT
jgi:hypothetical protein